MKNTDFIGQFKVQTNVIRVTDPSYDRGTWCAGCIEDVKTGTWEARIKTIDDRVGELHAYHVDIKKETTKKPHWIEQEFEVGVDSGQCGFFEDDIYPVGDTGEYGDEDTFYGQCCELTEENGVGLMDRGVVCSSGYGDGSYTSYTLEEKGKVVGVKIIFIDESGDDYEGNEDDDYSEDEFFDED